jgi:RNA polymerase sigma-70 factor (ECF subfamily)
LAGLNVVDTDACTRARRFESTTGSVETREPAAPDPDRALLDACLDGADKSAFTTLVGRHQDYVFRLVLSVLGPGGEGDAQDVTQDVFIRVAARLSEFRRESSFKTWLRRVALNMALDRRRRARWRKPHVDPAVLDDRPTADRQADPFQSADAAETRRAVAACLHRLPDATRTVIHLHYWLDLSLEEIAGMLQVPVGTVKCTLHRGRKLLYGAMKARGLS